MDKFGIVEVEVDPAHAADSQSGADQMHSEVFDKVYCSSVDDELGTATSLFVHRFGTPKKILYAACGAHVIDALFPESQIVYVDPLECAIRLLSDVIGERAKAIALPVEQFQSPEQFDMLFSLNSHAPTEEVLKRLKQGGFVFCNNYFGTKDAEEMIQSEVCVLCGVIDQVSDHCQYVLKTDELEEYLAFDSTAKFPSPPRKKIALYYIFQKTGRDGGT